MRELRRRCSSSESSSSRRSGEGEGRALLRPLGAPGPDAPGVGRIADRPGVHVLRKVGTGRGVPGLAGAAGRAGAAHLLRQLPSAHGLASAAWQHGCRRAGPDRSIGGARSIALEDSNPALLVPHGVQLRGLGAPLPRVRGRAAGSAASTRPVVGRAGFPAHLAVRRRVSSSTQNQAL